MILFHNRTPHMIPCHNRTPHTTLFHNRTSRTTTPHVIPCHSRTPHTILSNSRTPHTALFHNRTPITALCQIAIPHTTTPHLVVYWNRLRGFHHLRFFQIRFWFDFILFGQYTSRLVDLSLLVCLSFSLLFFQIPVRGTLQFHRHNR